MSGHQQTGKPNGPSGPNPRSRVAAFRRRARRLRFRWRIVLMREEIRHLPTVRR